MFVCSLGTFNHETRATRLCLTLMWSASLVLFATTTVNITWSFSSRHIRPPPWTSPLLQELSSPLTQSEGTLLCNFQGLWDKIILLCSNFFYKLERVKLRVERPPTVPEADVSPDPAFSIPLLYFYPSCSFSFSQFSSFDIPTSLFQTAILFRQGQRSSLHNLLWDKSLLLKIQRPFIHIVTRVDGVNSRWG